MLLFGCRYPPLFGASAAALYTHGSTDAALFTTNLQLYNDVIRLLCLQVRNGFQFYLVRRDFADLSQWKCF